MLFEVVGAKAGLHSFVENVQVFKTFLVLF